MIAQLATGIPVGGALDVNPGLMREAFQFYTVRGTHASIGDVSILTNEWRAGAPKNVIGEFLRYMIESGEGYISRRAGSGRYKLKREKPWERLSHHGERYAKPRADRHARRRLATVQRQAQSHAKHFPGFEKKYLEAFGRRSESESLAHHMESLRHTNLTHREKRVAVRRVLRKQIKQAKTLKQAKEAVLFARHVERHFLPVNRANPVTEKPFGKGTSSNPPRFMTFKRFVEKRNARLFKHVREEGQWIKKSVAQLCIERIERKRATKISRIKSTLRVTLAGKPLKWRTQLLNQIIGEIKGLRRGGKLPTPLRQKYYKIARDILNKPLFKSEAMDRIFGRKDFAGVRRGGLVIRIAKTVNYVQWMKSHPEVRYRKKKK